MNGGLYNVALGVNPFAPPLLMALGIDARNVPRIRDCWWDGEHIVLYTRTGGGNRTEYETENAVLRTVPGFVRDEDDDHDSTYAKFFYVLPEQFSFMEPVLIPMTQTSKERWDQAVSKIGKPVDPNDQESAKIEKALYAIAELFAKNFGDPSNV